MKAILVIDMPKECCECPCFYDYLHCQAKDGVNVLGDERPNECPLIPMPQRNKYDVKKYATVDYENNITLGHYMNMGWNDCIDEILGEENE